MSNVLFIVSFQRKRGKNKMNLLFYTGIIIAIWLFYKNILPKIKNIIFLKSMLWCLATIWILNLMLYRWFLDYFYLILIFAPLLITFIWGHLNKINPSKNKIKNDLGTDNVIEIKKSFTKRIGGFIMPALPFFYVKNKKWKSQEADIHEQHHISLLLNKSWLMYLIFFTIFQAILVVVIESFVNSKIIITSISAMLFSLFFTYFEKVTIDETRKYAEKNKITVRPKTMMKGIYFKYFFIYFMQIFIFMSILRLVYWSVGW